MADQPALREVRRVDQQYRDARLESRAAAQAEAERDAWSQVMSRIGIIGVVFVAFAGYMWRMRSTIGAQLRDVSATLLGASESLAQTAAHVTATSQSLSQGATEQAASLEETSASWRKWRR